MLHTYFPMSKFTCYILQSTISRKKGLLFYLLKVLCCFKLKLVGAYQNLSYLFEKLKLKVKT